MTAPLRSLLLGFSIDVSGQEKLDRVDSSVESLIDKVGKLGQVMASAFLFKEIGSFVGSTIDAGRSLEIASEKLGVTTDDLERYRFAADQCGVETATLDRALMLLNRTIGEAEQGNAGVAKAFSELGVSVLDAHGKAKPLSDLMPEIAGHFANISDQGTKTDVAMRLFGRGGAALIPLLDQGADGLKRFSAEFDALGGGMGADFARDAKEAGDGIRRLTFTFDVLRTRIVGAVLPWVERLVTMFTRFTVGLSDVVKHSDAAQTALIALAVAATIAFAPFLASILPIVAALTALYLIFDDIYTMFTGGHSALGKFLDDMFGAGTKVEFIEAAKEAWSDFLTVLRKGWEEIKGIDFKGLFVEFSGPIRTAADLIHVALMELKELLHLISGNPDIVKQRPISKEEAAARLTEGYYDTHPKETGAQSASFYDLDPSNAYRPHVDARLEGLPTLPAHTPTHAFNMLDGIDADTPAVKMDVKIGDVIINHPNGVDEATVQRAISAGLEDWASQAVQNLPPSPANNAGDGSQGK